MQIFKPIILSFFLLILLSFFCTSCGMPPRGGGGGGENTPTGEVDGGINRQLNPDPIVTPVPS